MNVELIEIVVDSQQISVAFLQHVKNYHFPLEKSIQAFEE